MNAALRKGPMLSIEALTIRGVAGIEALSLLFRPGLNLITGPNGSGKTTILECLGHSFYAFAESSALLRRSARHKRGTWRVSAQMGTGERRESKDFAVEIFHPSEIMFLTEGFEAAAKEVIVLKSNRVLPYTEVRSISRDPENDENRFTREAAAGAPTIDAKNWFVHRYLWSAHVSSLSDAQMRNLSRARDCFSLLDRSVTFSRVMPETNDILVGTPDGEIYLEYLSSGYQSCLSLLLGLIKEIEYRFKDPPIDVTAFRGLILIDEIDLHLHPLHHVKLLSALRNIFSNAQIIATTMSPHLVQAADPGEVIALGFDGVGRVRVRDVKPGPLGFQGWTVEEILRDVMGVTDTRSPVYLQAVSDLEKALAARNRSAAHAAWKALDLMLHPKNPSREALLKAVQDLDATAS